MKTLQDFDYQNVLVLGLARSGEAAAQLLYDSNINFKINDLTPLNENDIAKRFHDLGIEVITGEHPFSVLEEVDLVVKNPGIPYHHELIKEAERREIPIITEVELAYYLIDGPIVAITGSNGKTTTTTLIHEILNAAGLKPLIAGNIGKVASQVAREQNENQPVIMELSSFQLKAINELKPDIAVLLNITEAHLDYHKTMGDYIQSKMNISKNQTSEGLFIYNEDDLIVANAVRLTDATLMPFSLKKENSNGAYMYKEALYYKGEKIMDRKDIALPGDHNLENVLASVAVAKYFNVKNSVITQVLKAFTGVKHRLQFLGEVQGCLVYNDSKATNIKATLKAIQAFQEPIVLIAGGLDRGNEYDELIHAFDYVKHCVTYGESAMKIKEAALRNHYTTITTVDNLEQATIKAFQLSEEGNIILFSPACASWDQFKSFEERGDMFIELVHKF
ncbi:UDP-N-acetylmuramoyl-L-alanine--D-glutamate ligase [Filobacillus milosensis]|uniref:UDP-N-acetylmuramoylalanine--D-glutamate ligase n=1 Tax=Filobacillus milosensis TaxID=94137 RepID=A0A4Y8IRJ6_9BACI|nr:UDP-N-acetylmuramoyl-L-alanine--D-glutamate ligase [Filobacillus milosensis]TFB23298.1 UDP-N-acetylmuramoyl-L-alanine--D-glutamate ligase [Filobacillus milosensis]